MAHLCAPLENQQEDTAGLVESQSVNGKKIKKTQIFLCEDKAVWWLNKNRFLVLQIQESVDMMI